MDKSYILLFAGRSKTAGYCGGNENDMTLFACIEAAILEGYECFLFCAEKESGLRFAKQVLLRKKLQRGNKTDKIILAAVIADENCMSDKNEKLRNEYFDILEKCDRLIDLKSDESRCCEKFIISKSSKIISG